MAETIDLTPADANYSLVVRIGNDAVTVTPSADGNTVINTALTAVLIGGTVDHIAIDFDVVQGVGGTFKKPPFVLNCKLREATVNAPAIGGQELPIADFTNYVILTPDGRIYFKPSLLGAIKKAMPDGIYDIPSSIAIDVEAVPVYKNPSGESPEYEATFFTIYLNTSEIEMSALAPTDWAENMRWIEYASSTALTPAGIDAITGV